MSLYRVMVSGEREYWETLDIEAEDQYEAEAKAIDRACRQHEQDWDHSTEVINIKIEHVELLEEDPKADWDQIPTTKEEEI